MTTKLVEIKLNAKKKKRFSAEKKYRFVCLFVLLEIYFEILITTFNGKTLYLL